MPFTSKNCHFQAKVKKICSHLQGSKSGDVYSLYESPSNVHFLATKGQVGIAAFKYFLNFEYFFWKQWPSSKAKRSNTFQLCSNFPNEISRNLFQNKIFFQNTKSEILTKKLIWLNWNISCLRTPRQRQPARRKACETRILAKKSEIFASRISVPEKAGLTKIARNRTVLPLFREPIGWMDVDWKNGGWRLVTCENRDLWILRFGWLLIQNDQKVKMKYDEKRVSNSLILKFWTLEFGQNSNLDNFEAFKFDRTSSDL